MKRGLPWMIWGVLAAFCALAIWFSWVIPPFESPDEHYHYAFARHLAQGNPLPVQSEVVTGPWKQEGSQAPLYYMIVGLLTSSIDQSDFAQLSYTNPRANIGDPLFPGNKNRMLYSSADRALTGANLALHIGRWFSVFLGSVTLLSLYATAMLAFPTQRWLAVSATSVLAFLPQFVFISASFNNDNLIIAVSSVTVFWLCHLLAAHADPARPQPDVPIWKWAILGILLGLAALSKLQGLALWLLAALTGALIAWRRQSWRSLLRAALPVAVPALLLAGWWYWRNFSLYGDWTGLNHLAAVNGERTSPLTWASWWGEFRGLRYSFWGLFGWFNILLPAWIYTLLDAITLLAVLGWIFALGRWAVDKEPRRKHQLLVGVSLVLWMWAIIAGLALLYWISRAIGSQARLIFPALTALIILFVKGLTVWPEIITTNLSGKRQPDALRLGSLPGVLAIFLLGCTLYTGAWIFPRTYTALQTVSAIPADATPVRFQFGDDRQFQLLAVQISPNRYAPGDWVEVTLYLVLSPSDPTVRVSDYQIFIQLLDAQRQVVGNVTTHPGWGRNPTSLWQPGVIYADTYAVPVTSFTGDVPLLADIYFGFAHAESEDAALFPLASFDANGDPVELTLIGQVVLDPRPTADKRTADQIKADQITAHELNPVQIAFADSLQVAATRIDPPVQNVLTARVLWQADGAPGKDYTAFVHLRNAAGEQVAGFDQPPAPGRFPTSVWLSGDVVLSHFPLHLSPDLPAGRYTLWIGLYADGGGFERLPVLSTPLPVQDQSVQIGQIDLP